MYSDGNEDYSYVAYNVNDEGVNGRNGDQFYVPNDDGGVILSLNTLVFGGNGSLQSGPRYEAPEAVQQQIQPSFQSVLEGLVSLPNVHGPQASSLSSSQNISGQRQRSSAGSQGLSRGLSQGLSQGLSHSINQRLVDSIDKNIDQILGNIE